MSSDFKWISSYKTIEAFNENERAAHFLDWAAKKHPQMYVPLNFILKATRGYAKAPTSASQDVTILKARMSRIAKILETKYGRFIDSRRHLGYRATVDDNDKMDRTITKREKGVVSAVKRLEAGIDTIDRKELAPANRTRFDSTTKVLDAHASDLIKRLTAGTPTIVANEIKSVG